MYPIKANKLDEIGSYGRTLIIDLYFSNVNNSANYLRLG